MNYDEGLQELSSVAYRILRRVRTMAARGDSRWSIDSYLGECRLGFLDTAQAVQAESHSDTIEDMARAIRYTSPNAEVLGALIVLAAVSGEILGRGLTNFRTASASATQKVRAEIRDHYLIGVCDTEEIRLGAELALHSLQPILEPVELELLAA